jgi:predicted RNA-binding protein
MCLAKIRLNDESRNAFEDIAILHIEDGTIRLRTLFGEEQEITGRVREINFQNSTVLLETTAAVR